MFKRAGFWLSAMLGLFAVPTVSSAQTYCTPTNSGGFTACGSNKLASQSMGIALVKIDEQVVFSTGTCADVAYADYSATNSGTVMQGHSYIFTLSRHTQAQDPYTCHMSIFVDYNNDGIFGNAASGELVWQTGGLTTQVPSDTSDLITIPYQSTGALRMRVVSNYNAPATNPCATEQGQVYDFTLNVLAGEECAGAPEVATVSPVTSSKCDGTTNVLTLSGLTPASGYTYQWKVGPTASGPFSNASGTSTNSTYTTPGTLPFPTSYYVCEVTCSGGSTTVSEVAEVATTSFMACYCSAPFTSTTQTNRGLTGVSLNGSPALSNTGTTANNTYTDYSSLTPAGLTAGLSYTLSTTSGSQNTQNYRAAWIDFNQNGIYEASEFLGVVSTSGTHSNSTLAINFTVPVDAVPGVTGMRVRCRYSSTMANNQACSSFNSSGETEDYRVLIIAACTSPTVGASASNVVSTTTSANLSWTNGNGDGGRLVLLKQGSAVNALPISGNTYTANAAFGSGQQLGSGNYVVYNGTGNSVNITNLLPSTTYYYSILEYNEEATCYVLSGHSGSFTTESCSPVMQASNFHFPCPNYDALTMNFSRGSGTHVLVLARAGSAVDGTPTYGATYNANAQFGSGDQIGAGNYVVYNGSQAGMVSFMMTGLNANTTYYFKVFEYNSEPNCYSISPVSVSQDTRGAGTYGSSTVTQVTGNVAPWTINQQIVRLEVVVNGGTDAATIMEAITFSTAGSTSTSNISAAKIFYTGTSNTFAAHTQFGSTVTSPNGSHTVTGNMVLAPAGTHYFWVAYDIIENAVLGNVLDAQVLSFQLTDHSETGVRIPSVTNPTGSRTISLPSLSYCVPSSRPGCASYGYYPIPTLNGYTYSYSCNGNYQDLTSSISGATVSPGGTYSLSCYVDDWIGLNAISYAWFDWDKNGTFDVSERVGPIGPSGSVSVNVPANAVPGSTTMRVYMHTEGGRSNPCQTGNGALSTAIGHIIDVKVNVTGTPPGGGPPVICETPAPVVTPFITYTQGDVASPLTATGSNLLWYTTPSGGTGSSTAPTPSTSTVGTTIYYVSQTDGCESTRSQIAVYVQPAACGPVIDEQPAANTAGCYSGYTQIIVQATGADSYQWQVSMNGGNTWNNISNNNKYSGVNTNVLTITNPTSNYNGYMYRVIVNGGGIPVISDASTLTVQNCPPNDNPSNTNPSLTHLGYVYPNNVQVSGSTEGATVNPLTGTRDVWYRMQAFSNGVSIKVSSNVIDPIIYLFDDNDMSAPLDVENLIEGTGTEILNYDGLEEGNLYRIAIASASEVDGNFSIVVQQLRKPECSANTELSLCGLIHTTITGAHNIVYSFTDVLTDVTTTYSTSNYYAPLNTTSLGLGYGRAYTTHYTAYYNLQNGLGEPETIVVPNTESCNIVIGPHKEVVVKANNRCSSGAVFNRTGYLTGEYTGTGGQCNITGFEFEFTPVANCAGDDPQVLDKFIKPLTSNTPYISLNYVFNA
ncbi:MAG TPA: GEVED domain-containing protein, partial [Flavobacteriales bacterium]